MLIRELIRTMFHCIIGTGDRHFQMMSFKITEENMILFSRIHTEYCHTQTNNTETFHCHSEHFHIFKNTDII